MEQHKCRLCGAETKHKFTLDVLGKYKVGYFECLGCECLQTEEPYWLGEAYAIPGVHIDVGQAARVIQTWIRLNFLLEAIGFEKSSKCVDYGGSAGLLTRLMRDSGYQYFAYDPYDGSKYANYFRLEELKGVKPALVTAFEVFEHFPDPGKSIDEILSAGPELLVFSQQFYEGQGPDWNYLVPFCGQHVFFYREHALRSFAEERGYSLMHVTDFWILVRKAGNYFSAVEATASLNMPDTFAGEVVNRIGWGTSDTERDSKYAKERFQQELSTSVPNRSPRVRLAGLARKLLRV